MIGKGDGDEVYAWGVLVNLIYGAPIIAFVFLGRLDLVCEHYFSLCNAEFGIGILV